MMNIIAGMKYNLTVKFCTLVLKLWLHYYNLCMPNLRCTICILYQYFLFIQTSKFYIIKYIDYCGYYGITRIYCYKTLK